VKKTNILLPSWDPQHVEASKASEINQNTVKTIAIISSKGGTGKSTIAVNLLVAAHLSGQRCQVIDLDQQGSATEWADKRSSETLEVVETNPKRLSKILDRARETGIELAILETPGQTTADFFEVADLVIIPTSPSGFDVNAIAITLTMAANSPAKYGVIFNRIRPQSNAEKLEGELRAEGVTVGPSLCLRKDFEISAEGRGVLEINPKGAAAKEIGELYEWAMGELERG